jgi:hypothetical protein
VSERLQLDAGLTNEPFFGVRVTARFAPNHHNEALSEQLFAVEAGSRQVREVLFRPR